MALGYQVADPEPATRNNKTKWMEDKERKPKLSGSKL